MNPTQPETLLSTVKELAAALRRSEDYAGDMKRGGFQLPATLGQAVHWIHRHGPPTRYRKAVKSGEKRGKAVKSG